MMMRKAIITNSGVVLFFCGVVLLLTLHSAQNRIYLPSPRTAVIPASHDALALWNDSGVRGRILLLFDRKFNITYPGSISPEMTPDRLSVKDNYVYLSTVKNITRMIYHVVPEPSWGEVEQALSDYPMVSFDGVHFTMVIYDGIPLTITRIRDIPPVKEPVLVQINGDQWTDDDIADILQALGAYRIRSDFVTLSGRFSDESLKAFRDYAKTTS